MIRAEKAAPKLTNVGFNYIIEPNRRAFKARLAAGEFGVVREVRIFGRWTRGSIYYTRANWAGRLLLDDKLVLDSPMGNAMAHLAHNALYWAGDAPETWAPVVIERAELYHAHPIQGADTVFVEAETPGPVVRVAMTHACIGQSRDYEEVICDDAVLTTRMGWAPATGHYRDFTIRWTDGREEMERLSDFRHLDENFRAYFAYARGEQPRPVTTLADSRPFVHLNDLAYLAAGRVTQIPDDALRHERDDRWGAVLEIADIDDIMTRFLGTGAFPSAQDVPWAAPGGTATTKELSRLADTVATMVE